MPITLDCGNREKSLSESFRDLFIKENHLTQVMQLDVKDPVVGFTLDFSFGSVTHHLCKCWVNC